MSRCILHILDHSIPLHSGYTFRTHAILREQAKLGWETLHLTGCKQQSGQLLVEQVDGLEFHRTPGNSFAARLPVINQWAVIHTLEQRLDQLISHYRPDVLHAHSPALNGIAAIRAARRHRLPVVYEVRAFWEDAAVDHGTTREGSPRYRATRTLESWVLKRANAVTTICEGLRQDIIARGVPASRVTVIPNAVDLDAFKPRQVPDSALRDQLGLGKGPILGFLGSFYAYEGLPLLLRALPAIRARHPGVQCLLVGGGPQDVELHRLAEGLVVAGEPATVVMPGRVPHNEVTRYYNLVDVLVYPRLPMRLTELVTPLKPLEAMAQEQLLVASDVGGHRELIDPGKTGILFKAGEVDDLAAAVNDLLDSPEQWSALRQAARAFVAEERSWSRSVERYGAVYEAL